MVFGRLLRHVGAGAAASACVARRTAVRRRVGRLALCCGGAGLAAACRTLTARVARADSPAPAPPPAAFPVRMRATVVKGFGRGGKLLGCPTANMDMQQIGRLADEMPSGIYFGLAKLEGSDRIFKAAISVGWNPQFNNKEKTVEPHLLAELEDFYGRELRLMILGYIRPEMRFESMEALIEAIRSDIRVTDAALDDPAYDAFKEKDPFWHS